MLRNKLIYILSIIFNNSYFVIISLFIGIIISFFSLIAGFLFIIASVIINLSFSLINSIHFRNFHRELISLPSENGIGRLSNFKNTRLENYSKIINRVLDSLSQEIVQTLENKITSDAIINSINEGILIINSNKELENFNPALVKLLGTNIDPYVGMNINDFVRNDEFLSMIDEVFSTKENKSIELNLFSDEKSILVYAAPFFLSDQEPFNQILVIFTNLTEIRKADNSRKEFFSNVSHELRTPLAGIKASAETLEISKDQSTTEKFTLLILEDVDRMNKLIDEMMSLTQMDLGEENFVKKDTSVNKMIEDTYNRFIFQCEDLGINLKIKKLEQDITIKVDISKIEQVFGNLLSNAIKWTSKDGNINISASLSKTSILFSVSDDGEGIIEEHLPFIFERFFKSDSSRSKVGSGLGLAISKHIIEAHKGDIFVESEITKGSKFTFSIPK
ncbi:MAG: PAS domain-containing protein [SAR202 cluster bacterium]|nr:PAS domain-containing protein [SAR202 cluster bacterium]